MMEELKPPQKIYLQDYCEDYLSDGNTTWCDDKQNDDDIEYILQSEYDQLKAENERLLKALDKVIQTTDKYEVDKNDSNDYWDWTDNGIDIIVEIEDIAKKALKEVKE